MTFSKKFVV